MPICGIMINTGRVSSFVLGHQAVVAELNKLTFCWSLDARLFYAFSLQRFSLDQLRPLSVTSLESSIRVFDK